MKLKLNGEEIDTEALRYSAAIRVFYGEPYIVVETGERQMDVRLSVDYCENGVKITKHVGIKYPCTKDEIADALSAMAAMLRV